MSKLLQLPAFTSCHSVMLYTATKSFESFRQPKNVQDEKKSVDNAVPKSTAYKTKWSCKVFEEWKQNRLVKSCILKPGGLFTPKDFEVPFQKRVRGFHQVTKREKTFEKTFEQRWTHCRSTIGYPNHKLDSSAVSATITVDSSRELVSRNVEKVSQNVDMDTLPVYFGDFKKCTVNFNFK